MTHCLRVMRSVSQQSSKVSPLTTSLIKESFDFTPVQCYLKQLCFEEECFPYFIKTLNILFQDLKIILKF